VRIDADRDGDHEHSDFERITLMIILSKGEFMVRSRPPLLMIHAVFFF
jgi:hypothetical protein